MARPRKYDYGTKPFAWPDGNTVPVNTESAEYKKSLPTAKRNLNIMSSESNRDFAGHLLKVLSRDFGHMKKCNTDSELIERIDDYFSASADRRVPPTVEGMMLYCGASRGAFFDWLTGKAQLKHDIPGVLTSDVVQNAQTLLAAYDGTLASQGVIDRVAYIFRSKNYYGMRDESFVNVTADTKAQPLTAEEIAKRLPDTDYKVE